MNRLARSLLLIISLIGFQVVFYTLFLKSGTLGWGATEDEMNMRLPGDHLAPGISATRAISINATVSEVWGTITQLGADRKGFFSYSFLETAMGYKSREPTSIATDNTEMPVGRVIHGSIDPSQSMIEYSFTVVEAEPGVYFVLKNWGTFYLKAVNPEMTRLIVRTHGIETDTITEIIADFLGTGAHYLMERRMLIGVKTAVEKGFSQSQSALSDNIWLLTNFLSYLGLLLMVILGRGIMRWLLSGLIGVLWLFTLLVFPPEPVFGIVLLVIITLSLLRCLRVRSSFKK